MFKNNYKWGILGTSYISEVMAEAIHSSNTSELIAIGSRTMDSAKDFSNKFSVPKSYHGYEALLDDKEIDAVYIGLPNHLHKEWIIKSAQAGKHILCEKPFVISVSEAHEVITTIKKSNVFCMEALMYKSHPLTKKLQEIIHSNILGEIRLFNAIYTANIADLANKTAGGSIRNLGCYPVSLIRLLAQSEPIEIKAMGRMHPSNNTDNQASVILKFKNDALAVISVADNLEKFSQFEIHGTQANLKLSTNPWFPDQENNKIIISRHDEETPYEINLMAEKPLYTYQIDLVNHYIGNSDIEYHNEMSLKDSLGNIVVVEAWHQQVTF
jgi:predicted dehydrogenase